MSEVEQREGLDVTFNPLAVEVVVLDSREAADDVVLAVLADAFAHPPVYTMPETSS